MTGSAGRRGSSAVTRLASAGATPRGTAAHSTNRVTRQPSDEGDDLRTDAEPGGDERRRVLVAAVDPEQLGVLAADPEHEGLAADLDLEVVVR